MHNLLFLLYKSKCVVVGESRWIPSGGDS